ncbi:MAG: GtrA family protein [Pseudomonadota bacterium]
MAGARAAPSPPLTARALVVRYSVFAVIATIVNLGAQRVALAFLEPPIAFPVALVAGTGLGLVVKYLLDRRWIFGLLAARPRDEARRFSLYTLTGVVTTLLFWATETAFWLAWQTDMARELGAVIGLAMGYTIKYRLDRAFVFRQEPAP